MSPIMQFTLEILKLVISLAAVIISFKLGKDSNERRREEETAKIELQIRLEEKRKKEEMAKIRFESLYYPFAIIQRTQAHSKFSEWDATKKQEIENLIINNFYHATSKEQSYISALIEANKEYTSAKAAYEKGESYIFQTEYGDRVGYKKEWFELSEREIDKAFNQLSTHLHFECSSLCEILNYSYPVPPRPSNNSRRAYILKELHSKYGPPRL